MQNRFCFFFLLLTVLLPLSAQNPRDRLKERQGKEADPFSLLTKMYDKDGDQKISEAELTQTCVDRWSKLDQNQDNQVNEEELKKSMEYLKEMKEGHPLFNRFDKDGDGKVTAEELEAVPPKFKQKVMENDLNKDGNITLGEYLNSISGGIFKKMDKNKDEALDEQEVKNEKLFQALDQDKNKSLTRDEFKNAAFSKFFTSYDKNQDRVVTAEEYLNENKARFQKADKNKDGAITKDEVKPRSPESEPIKKEGEISENEVESLLNEITGTESNSEAESLLEGF
ncbi:MAG: EF-hand domain-containing protein [Planctomycetota bacterium]